jgi:hypothetical protein
MERRSRKERRFSCIEFSAKSVLIMVEAIELSGANPKDRPRQKLRSLVRSLLHHAKYKLSPSRSLSLSSGANVGKRKHSSGFCIPHSPPPFYYPIFKNLNDFRVYNSWRQLIFFCFFVARFCNLLASNFQITNIHSSSFVFK